MKKDIKSMSNEIFKKVSAAFVSSQQGGFTSHGARMEMSLSLQSVKLTDIFFHEDSAYSG